MNKKPVPRSIGDWAEEIETLEPLRLAMVELYGPSNPAWRRNGPALQLKCYNVVLEVRKDLKYAWYELLLARKAGGPDAGVLKLRIAPALQDCTAQTLQTASLRFLRAFQEYNNAKT